MKRWLNYLYIILYPAVTVVTFGMLRIAFDQYVSKTYRLFPHYFILKMGTAAFIAICNFLITKYTIRQQTCMRRAIFIVWTVMGVFLFCLSTLYTTGPRIVDRIQMIVSRSEDLLLLITFTYLANAFIKNNGNSQ